MANICNKSRKKRSIRRLFHAGLESECANCRQRSEVRGLRNIFISSSFAVHSLTLILLLLFESCTHPPPICLEPPPPSSDCRSDRCLAPVCPQRAHVTAEVISSVQLRSGPEVPGPRGGAGSAHSPILGEQGLGLCDRCQGDWPVPVQQRIHTSTHTEAAHALILSQLLQLLAQSV